MGRHVPPRPPQQRPETPTGPGLVGVLRRALRRLTLLPADPTNLEQGLFRGLPVTPYWHGQGRLGWRWRLLLAWRSLNGYELGGFNGRATTKGCIYR